VPTPNAGHETTSYLTVERFGESKRTLEVSVPKGPIERIRGERRYTNARVLATTRRTRWQLLHPQGMSPPHHAMGGKPRPAAANAHPAVRYDGADGSQGDDGHPIHEAGTHSASRLPERVSESVRMEDGHVTTIHIHVDEVPVRSRRISKAVGWLVPARSARRQPPGSVMKGRIERPTKHVRTVQAVRQKGRSVAKRRRRVEADARVLAPLGD